MAGLNANAPERLPGKGESLPPILIIRPISRIAKEPGGFATQGIGKTGESRHPEYVERNRMLQRERRGRYKREVAKMDASEPLSEIKTGSYYVVPESVGMVAKMDASALKVRLILMA